MSTRNILLDTSIVAAKSSEAHFSTVSVFSNVFALYITSLLHSAVTVISIVLLSTLVFVF